MFVGTVKFEITFITLLSTIQLYVEGTKLMLYRIAAPSVVVVTFITVDVDMNGL